MRAAVLVVVLAGCGRIDFDDYLASRDGTTSDAKLTGTRYDEDGDGYGDACDDCPVASAPQQADRHGVGDMPSDRLGVLMSNIDVASVTIRSATSARHERAPRGRAELVKPTLGMFLHRGMTATR